MRTRLALLSDLHLVDDPARSAGAWHNPYDFAGMPARLDDAMGHIASSDVDTVVLLGDLGHHGSSEALTRLTEHLAPLAVPIVMVAGNHDVAGPDETASRLGRSVELATPRGRPVGSQHVAGVHVARGGWFGAHLVAPPEPDGWPDELVVLLSHFPILSHATRLADRGHPYPGDIAQRRQIAERLGERDAPTIVLSGHIHARDVSTAGPVLQLTQGALVEAPYEWSIVEIETTPALSVTRTAIETPGPPATGPTPTLAPTEITWAYANGTWHSTSPIDFCAASPTTTEPT